MWCAYMHPTFRPSVFIPSPPVQVFKVRHRHLARSTYGYAATTIFGALDAIWVCSFVHFFAKTLSVVAVLFMCTSMRKLTRRLQGGKREKLGWTQWAVGLSTTCNFALTLAFPGSAVLQILELCHFGILAGNSMYFCAQYIQVSQVVITGAVDQAVKMHVTNQAIVRASKVHRLKGARKNFKINAAVCFGMGQVLFLTFVLLLNPLWPGHDETSSSCQRRNWNDQSSLVTFRLSTYGVAVFVACLCAITTIVAFSPKKKKERK